MSGEEIVVLCWALAWIFVTVRGIRRMDACEQYRARRDAFARITRQEQER